MRTQDRIQSDIITAQKAKDTLALSVLRGLKAAFSQASLLKGNIQTELSEPEQLAVIRKQIAQREESARQYREHGATDKAEKENAEAEILQKYLPAALTENELDALVTQAIVETGATTRKDMGKAIKRANELAAGRADGKTLSGLIQARLS